jgi:origin recognition complex subunit 3
MATIEDRNSQKTSYFLVRAKRQKLYDERSEAVKRIQHKHQLEIETSPIEDPEIPFVRLLGGNESVEAASRRWELYNEAWEAQEKKIHQLLETANTQVLDDIENFIRQPWDNSPEARIDTSIILPGSNIANHIRLFSQINDRVKQMDCVHMVSLTSKACVNLKTALKIIVANLTERDEDPEQQQQEETEGGDEGGDDLRFDKRLRYDLDILADWCKKQVKLNPNVDKLSDLRIIISIEDADSFDIPVLTGLIKMVQSYLEQIPMKLMLSVATSLEVFQEKLPRSCVRLLNGTAFHAQMADGIMKILDATMFTFDQHTLLLGPRLFDNLVHRQRESIESVDAFIASLKYIFMSHYYSNPFVLLAQCGIFEDETYDEGFMSLISKDHLKAIRMTTSFRNFVNEKIANGDTEDVKDLLEDDEYLKSIIIPALEEFRQCASNILAAIDIVIALQKANGDQVSSKIDLYIGALSSELWNEPFLAELIESVAEGGVRAGAILMEEFKALSSKGGILMELYDFLDSGFGEFISEYSWDNDDEDSSENMEISAKIVAQVCQFLQTSLQPYNKCLLYEVFVADTAKLQEDVFLPTQRPALELALCEPKHYIGEQNRPGYHDPHLSILYQLYRESSVFINSFDYYTAFKEMLPEPSEEEKPNWEKKTLAWFLQGIAELKLLGIIRDSKRKFECVEKVAWKDL